MQINKNKENMYKRIIIAGEGKLNNSTIQWATQINILNCIFFINSVFLNLVCFDLGKEK